MTHPDLLVSTRKGLFRFRRGEGGWEHAGASFVGDPVSIALPLRDGRTVFAALDHGHFGTKLQVSRDGGETFEQAATPEYPPKPEGEVDLDPMRKTERKWSLELIWSMAEGTPDQEGRLWCGTIPGGLFRSDDGGASWEIVRSLWDEPKRKTSWFGGGYDAPGIHSIVVDPSDGRHVLVAISCGGVWRTRDDGATWEQTAHGMRAEYVPPDQALEPDSQDPHLIASCAARPEVIWCQHHNGIFRSTDFGKSWVEVEDVAPSAFGFAVAVDPKDPDRAWFAPAIKDERRVPVDGRFVVTRTQDGGRSFESLTRGLPEGPAYDLVFRHALGVSPDGQVLALGSTTGNLWLSEDHGETFTQVSGTLPPIHGVHFQVRP